MIFLQSKQFELDINNICHGCFIGGYFLAQRGFTGLSLLIMHLHFTIEERGGGYFDHPSPPE